MAPEATRTSFDVILKVAERCNLACRYCYYYFHEYDGNQNQASMLPEVLAEVPRFLRRSVDELHLDQLNIGLHGGEPLLLKKPLFDKLCGDIRAAVGERTRLELAVQTNGVLIDDEWIDIFARHKVGVGVSIDGPKELHDKHRVDHAGRGSYDATVAGLRKLQAAVASGRLEGAGALAVLDVEGGEELLRFLTSELGVRNPNVNYPRGGHDCAEAQTWNRAVESHRKTVRYALHELLYPRYHYVRGITNVLLGMHSDQGAAICDRVAAVRHTIATISSEGRLLADDNLLSVDPRFADSNLTIFGTSLRDYVESPLWQGLTEAMDYIPAKCRQCPWYRACRSGEVCSRFTRQTSTLEESVLCETLQMVHEEAADYLLSKGIVTIEQLGRRLAERPTVTARQVVRKMLKQEGHDPAATTPVATMRPLDFDFGGSSAPISRQQLLRKVAPAAATTPDGAAR